MSKSEGDIVRLHAILEGRVQGVSFRYFVREQAQDLGVTGWVRNRWDDTVEVTAEGERSKLEMMLSSLRTGPPAAMVTNVKTDWTEATGEFKQFGILPTY
jgi:acylphosphatase